MCGNAFCLTMCGDAFFLIECTGISALRGGIHSTVYHM